MNSSGTPAHLHHHETQLLAQDSTCTHIAQSDIFQAPGQFAIAGNGAARRIYMLDNPNGSVAHVTAVEDWVHRTVLGVLNSPARERRPQLVTPRYVCISSGNTARIHPNGEPNDTLLTITTFEPTLVHDLMEHLNAAETSADVQEAVEKDRFAEAYTKGAWLPGIAPPEQLRGGPAVFTRVKTAEGLTILNCESGVYAPGDNRVAESNARRVLACVNKLQGVATLDLERLPDGVLAALVADYLQNDLRKVA